MPNRSRPGNQSVSEERTEPSPEDLVESIRRMKSSDLLLSTLSTTAHSGTRISSRVRETWSRPAWPSSR